MEKEEKKIEIDYIIDWEYSVEISKIRADLDALEKLGATHIEINADTYYDSAILGIIATFERIETDEEFSKRLEREKKSQYVQMMREIQEFERLKAKFGK